MSRKKHTELIELVERCMNFGRWGFMRSYSSPDVPLPFVIYDSEWCRVKFLHYGGDYADQWKEMHIYYGRLHAENDESLMIWGDEVCWCWHSAERYILNFLDGFSPEVTVENKSEPPVIHAFRESAIGKALHGPEWVANKHMAIWEYYGQGFFQLFDLRHPGNWENYRAFLSRVRILEDERKGKNKFQIPKHPGHPEIDEVC